MARNFFGICVILFVLFMATIAYAAPLYTPMRSVIPEEDSSYYLGTTTPSTIAWAGLIVDQICLASDCKTTWPTSSISWPFTPSSYDGVANQSTTTPLWLNGTRLIASSTLIVNATTTNLNASGQVDFDGLTSAIILTGAGGILAEYTGATCTNQFARSTDALGAWTCATVGTADVAGLDISADTNLTAGDGLTLTDDDIDFDGGASPGGSLGGTWASPTIDDLFILNTGDVGTGHYVLPSLLSTSASTTNATTTSSHYFPGSGVWNANGDVGINNITPRSNLHILNIMASTSIIRITGAVGPDNINNGPQQGLVLAGGNLNIALKYTPFLSFASADNQLLQGTDSKFLAGIAGYATENYNAVTDSGMGIEFFTTPDNAGASSTPVSRMVINQNGSVGIGETAPGSLLAVSGGATVGATYDTTAAPTNGLLVEGSAGFGTTTPQWALTASNATKPQLALTDAGGSSVVWTFRNIANTLYIATSTYTATSTTPIITINPNGLVGVASSSPWRTFSVNGKGAWTGLTTESGAGNVLCVKTGGEIVQDDSPITACSGASSRTVKHAITPLENGLDTILQLKPVSYVYNEDYSTDQTTHLGFIAEDVEPIEPLLIDEGEVKGLKYAEFAAPIVSAIQELNNKVDNISIGKVQKSAQNNWQWAALLILGIIVAWQQVQIITIKRK